MDTNQQYAIGANLLQGVLNYLADRPYGEVVQLIEGLRRAQPLNIAAPQKPDEKPPAPPARDTKKKA